MLRGTFATLPLPDLLGVLARHRRSGVLTCSSDKLTKRLDLLEGVIVAAESNDPNEMLGHYLISNGLVTREQLREALDMQERSNVRSGAALVKLGAITKERLEQALVEKSEEIVYSLFDWPQGTFLFQPAEEAMPQRTVAVRLAVDSVIMKGTVRQEELAHIREVFSRPDVVPRLVGEPPESLRGTALARRVQGLVDGRRTYAEIQLGAHGSEYHVGNHLFHLHQERYLQVLTPEAAPPVAPAEASLGAAESSSAAPPPGQAAPPATTRPTPAQPGQPVAPQPAAAAKGTAADLLANEADRDFRKGSYRDALQGYRAALSAGVDRPDLPQLIAGTETVLRDEIRRDLPPDRILQRLIDNEHLLSGNFKPEEFFLIEQVNGQWSVRDLVRLSPLPELDALLLLEDLVARKVLKVVLPWG